MYVVIYRTSHIIIVSRRFKIHLLGEIGRQLGSCYSNAIFPPSTLLVNFCFDIFL